MSIFLISSISSFEIIVIPGPKVIIYYCSAADASAVNSNGIKTLLVSVVDTFFINDKPAFSDGPRSLPKISPDFTNLEIWDFVW